MNLNKRQQVLALLAIALVGLFVADKIIFTPLVRSWKARSERLAALKKDFREGSDLLRNSDNWRARWDSMRTNMLAGERQEAESQMFKAFERWYKDGGVSVSSVRPQWKEGGDDYLTVECRADVSGSLPDIAHFLFQLERDPMGVKVDSLELSSRDVEGTQLSMVLQVSGLLLKAQENSVK